MEYKSYTYTGTEIVVLIPQAVGAHHILSFSNIYVLRYIQFICYKRKPSSSTLHAETTRPHLRRLG